MSSEPTTVILPIDLGAAARYDQHVFPLAYHDGLGGQISNVNKGSLLLSATLEEMVKIRELGIDLSNSSEFLLNTRVKYEALAAKRAKLQNNRKTRNPFKAFKNYRAARMFHAASRTLYLETKETSEKIQREVMQTVPSAEMHVVSGGVPADATISGIAIYVRGALDDNAIQIISGATNTIFSHASESFVNNPQLNDEDDISLANSTDSESLLSASDTADSGVDEDSWTPGTSSDLGWTDTISPSSPSTINNFHFYHNSVVTTNSNVSEMTVNHGSQNS